MTLLPLIASLLCITHAPAEGIYVGTYTSSGSGKGIYYVELDPGTGRLSEPVLAAPAIDPSYVALRPGDKFLYAVDESTDAVGAYSVGADHLLTRLNASRGIGSGPCYVSVSHDGRTVLTAGYGAGTLASLQIQPDGSLGPVVDLIRDIGSGPNKERQDGPHMHIAIASPDDKEVYTCDLGTDSIETFGLDTSTGKIHHDGVAATKAPAGGGPRHIAIYPGGRTMFVNNEMGGSVTSYAIDPTTGHPHPLQTISTLPTGQLTEGNTTAEIVLHPNAKWLYVSNRGHNSIAVFEVAADGQMKLIEIRSLNVKVPRGFDIDPTGKWLVVGGQATNELSVYAIDPLTGSLAATGQIVKVGSPVCLTFVR